MYGPDVRREALVLAEQGLSIAAMSRQLKVSRAAIGEWVADPAKALSPRTLLRKTNCFVCSNEECAHPPVYAYLLGQYLGDGYLVASARVPRLRIACADAYPGIAREEDARRRPEQSP